MTYFPNKPQEQPYTRHFEGPVRDDSLDDFPEEGLPEEDPRTARQRHRFRLLAAAGDFGAILICSGLILVLLTLLFSLLSWVQGDLTQSFTLLR